MSERITGAIRIKASAARRSGNPATEVDFPRWVWLHDDGRAVAYYGIEGVRCDSDWTYDSTADFLADYRIGSGDVEHHPGAGAAVAITNALADAGWDIDTEDREAAEFDLQTAETETEAMQAARAYIRIVTGADDDALATSAVRGPDAVLAQLGGGR